MQTTTATLAATPTKLRDGSWGARVESATVGVGATVTIRTKSGKSWQARIGRVLWTGDGVSICSTVSSQSGAAPRGGRTGCSCGSIEGRETARDCWTCRHDA